MMQAGFGAALLDPQCAVPEGLVTPDGRPATRRFDVYRNNVVVSLIEALGAAYPVIKKLVGDAFFDAMAGVYVRQYPPSSPLMILYGAELPAFLEGFPPAASLPYLPDVARLERARRESWHSADDPIADPAVLADLPAETLMGVRFGLHASVRIVASGHPIFGIWQANMQDGAPAPAATAQDVLVARPGDTLEMRTLPAGGAAFLAALAEGNALGPAAEAAGAAAPGFDLAANLAGMFDARLAARITIQ